MTEFTKDEQREIDETIARGSDRKYEILMPLGSTVCGKPIKIDMLTKEATYLEDNE